jgi:hypothetical protein
MSSRGVALGNRERRVDHRIYRFVGGPIILAYPHEIPSEMRKYLISSSISETREERSELPAHRGSRIFLENDLVQGSCCIGLIACVSCPSFASAERRNRTVPFLGCSSIVWQWYQPSDCQSCTILNKTSKTYRMENQ